MTLVGRITPASTWPSASPYFAAGDKYTEANWAEFAQALYNQNCVLRMGNLELTDFAAAGDDTGSLLAWAGTLRVCCGATGHTWKYRDMIGGGWSTDATRASTIGSASATGTTLGLLTSEDTGEVKAEFFATDNTVSATSTITGAVLVRSAIFSGYSSRFLMLVDTATVTKVYYATEASATWVEQYNFSEITDGTLAANPTGQEIVATGPTGAAGTVVSQDGGANWVAAGVASHSVAIVWDYLNSRWLRAHDTALTHNTTAGIIAGTAWTSIGSAFSANVSSMISLPAGILLVRLTDSKAYTSLDGGTTWTFFGAGCGALRMSNGYVAGLNTNSTYVSRRCF